MRVPGELMKVIELSSSHSVQSEGAVSEWKPMLAEVPQGSTLSPMLYNIYKLDIPKPIRAQLAVYEEDIYNYDQYKTPRFAHLATQRHLDDVGRWATRWRIHVSVEKTKAVVF